MKASKEAYKLGRGWRILACRDALLYGLEVSSRSEHFRSESMELTLEGAANIFIFGRNHLSLALVVCMGLAIIMVCALL